MLKYIRAALLEALELIVDQLHSIPILVHIDLKLVESLSIGHNLLRVLRLQFVEKTVGVLFVLFEVAHHLLILLKGSFCPLNVGYTFLVILQNEGLMLIGLCI